MKFKGAPCPWCGKEIEFHDLWRNEHNTDSCYFDCSHCGRECFGMAYEVMTCEFTKSERELEKEQDVRQE